MISGATQNQISLFQIVPLNDISYGAYRTLSSRNLSF